MRLLCQKTHVERWARCGERSGRVVSVWCFRFQKVFCSMTKLSRCLMNMDSGTWSCECISVHFNTDWLSASLHGVLSQSETVSNGSVSVPRETLPLETVDTLFFPSQSQGCTTLLSPWWMLQLGRTEWWVAAGRIKVDLSVINEKPGVTGWPAYQPVHKFIVCSMYLHFYPDK